MTTSVVTMYTTGTPTKFEFMPARQLDVDTYRIIEDCQSVWHRDRKVTAYVNTRGVTEAIRPAQVDPLFGEVQLHIDEPEASDVSLAGTFVPRSGVAGANRYRIEQSSIRTSTGVVPYMELTLEDIVWMKDSFFREIYDDKPILIEIETARGIESMRGWFKLSADRSRKEDPIVLRFKPHWLCGVSYGWNKNARNT